MRNTEMAQCVAKAKHIRSTTQLLRLVVSISSEIIVMWQLAASAIVVHDCTSRLFPK